MERITMTNTFQLPVTEKIAEKKMPEIEMATPQRGSTGPVRVGVLLEPIRQIINHPDRNRLMAELFRDYK